MSVLAPTNTDHRKVDEAKFTDDVSKPVLSDRFEQIHKKIHEFYQPDYLLKYPMWNHLPRHFTMALNYRLPPRFYLCIPFPTEEQVFVSACNLPWELLGPVPASSYYPEPMEGKPETCACEIASFFVMAMKKESDRACVLQLKYCVAANTSDLRRVPVLAFRDNHYDRTNTEQMREKVDQVMEKYLFPEKLWARRKTAWMLAYETVFEEDGEIAPHLCPGCSEYAEELDH